MIDKMGEIVWALNERNDSLIDLLSYSRSYATEYLSQNGITCIVKAPDNFPAVFVSGEFRRNIYLSFKEALHNIVKHAYASNVNIVIDITDQLCISLQDDGIGFYPHDTKPFSNGLTNMEKRMKDIGGLFEVIPGDGTFIRLTVPLPS
jgi:signal transduction histidine kinase